MSADTRPDDRADSARLKPVPWPLAVLGSAIAVVYLVVAAAILLVNTRSTLIERGETPFFATGLPLLIVAAGLCATLLLTLMPRNGWARAMLALCIAGTALCTALFLVAGPGLHDVETWLGFLMLIVVQAGGFTVPVLLLCGMWAPGMINVLRKGR